MTRPAVRTVLLDAGGVLLDLDYARLQRLLAERGIAATIDALSTSESIARTTIDRRVKEGGRTRGAWRDYFRIILRRAGAAEEPAEEMIDTLAQDHARFGLWTVAIEGAVETVRALKGAGYRLGVVSNAEGRVERDLDGAGYAGLFEVVVDSHLVGVEKPDPAIFRIAMERMRIDPADAVFVGDVPSVDVAGARAAGLSPILLDRHDLYTDVDAPRLRTIAELPGWLGAGTL
ncbi:MAG TPA: HAD family hydrolase [Candidatus Polarisedimenticolaceae bacterium]|nr:HAD family hydrolase [Candidatus Polarisedimenticolaceae bacterium]